MVAGEQDEPIEDADALPAWIRAQHSNVGERLGQAGGHEQWVYVWIGGNTYDYVVRVVAVRDGAAVGAPESEFRCACNNRMLLEALDGRIAAAVVRLRGDSGTEVAPPVVGANGTEGTAATRSSSAAGIEPDREHSVSSRPTTCSNDGRECRVGALGYTGIGVGVMGAGALGVGIGLARQPDRFRESGDVFETRSLRGAGVGLLVGGSVALATGATLLGVDLARARRRGLTLVPTFGGRLVGLAVVRKF
ncbi:hypothetical protein [Paraliomyxa miuraensis]|uniref:hypothetical protein n=1 Tax=Paraliomyxa miuraensis TaxID=376150 RepID=UPI002254F363|nr:hypothetical protein [Paraliomyxa miuraensis]MCX4247922.1 hypothetical protein [Paraliomyxa miuraensis]